MKPSVIFLSLFASCLLMGQELETYSGQYILRSGEIPFVCPDGRSHEIKYHYYTGAEGQADMARRMRIFGRDIDSVGKFFRRFETGPVDFAL